MAMDDNDRFLEYLNRRHRDRKRRGFLLQLLVCVVAAAILLKVDFKSLLQEKPWLAEPPNLSARVVVSQPDISSMPATQQCELSPPPNGRVYIFNASTSRYSDESHSKMELVNRHGYPIVLQINNAEQNVRYQAISVHSNSAIQVGVPLGTYGLTVMVGKTWCNIERGFLDGKSIVSKSLVEIRPGITRRLNFESRGTFATDLILTSTQIVPQSPKIISQPPQVQVNGSGVVELRRHANGSYYINGSVNGIPMTFQVDTGASTTSIPRELAYKAGIYSCVSRTFETANGSAVGCVGTARELTFGNFRAGGIEVVSMPNLKNPLLGMNVLSHVDMAQSGGIMRLYFGARNPQIPNTYSPMVSRPPQNPSAIQNKQETYAGSQEEGEESQDQKDARCWKTYAEVRDSIDARMRQGYSSQQGEWFRKRQRDNEKNYSECRSSSS